MKWTTKALIQRVLSRVPAGEKIYYIGQFQVGRLRHFKVDSKVQQGRRLLDSCNKAGVSIAGQRTVEIGTGWAPVIPLLFWLLRQKECHTYDTSELLSPSLVIESAKQLLALSNGEDFELGVGESRNEFEARRQLLRELVDSRVSGYDILQQCNIHYHAPVDAANTNLADKSVDVVYSNTVLEHIPQYEVDRLFVESYRILRPGGYILHLIDMSDHFAHSDRSISTINFLQFSEASFSQYNSRFLYQNRLRMSAWRQMIVNNGFQIIRWQTNINKDAMNQLPLLHLDKSFGHFSAEEVCTSSVCVLAKRP